MKLKLKKDAEGKPVWQEDKPVYVNEETGQDLAANVPELFDRLEATRHEAQDHREKKEAAEGQLQALRAVIGDATTPETLKATLAEHKRLKEAKPGDPKVKPPSEEELERLVQERFEAALAEKETEIEGLQAKVTLTETDLATAVGKHDRLLLKTEAQAAIDQVGIRSELRDDALRYVESLWRVEKDGQILRRGADGKPLTGTDPTKNLTILEDLQGLTRKEKRVWLPPAKGSQDPSFSPDGPSGVEDNQKSAGALISESFAIQP